MAKSFSSRLYGPTHGAVSMWKVLAVAVVLMLVGASCTGDDTDESETGGADTGADTSSGEIDLASFCNGAIEGESMFQAGPELDEEGNPTADSLEEFSGRLEPLLQDLEENAPEEVSSDVDTVVEGVRTALEEGDMEAVFTPEIFEADSAIDEYVFNNCELDSTQEIVAVNYAFEDVPENISPGQVGIRLDNQGEDLHEAVIFRIDDETDLSVEELLDLPEEEGQELAEFKGVAFAEPGGQASAVVDLEEGRYAFVCFIPVGATSLEDLEGPGGPEAEESPEADQSPETEESPEADQSPEAEESPDGEEQEGPPPHFTQGMFAEFTVG